MILRREESFRVPQVLFVAEQDGEPERLLKSQVEPLLRDAGLQGRGYLCQVRYGDDRTPTVALCLHVESILRDDLEHEVGAIFSSIFNASTSLDIIRLSAEQNVEIAEVCRPFYAVR